VLTLKVCLVLTAMQHYYRAASPHHPDEDEFYLLRTTTEAFLDAQGLDTGDTCSHEWLCNHAQLVERFRLGWIGNHAQLVERFRHVEGWKPRVTRFMLTEHAHVRLDAAIRERSYENIIADYLIFAYDGLVNGMAGLEAFVSTHCKRVL